MFGFGPFFCFILDLEISLPGWSNSINISFPFGLKQTKYFIDIIFNILHWVFSSDPA